MFEPPIVAVEFDVHEGGRGLNAFNIRLADAATVPGRASRPAVSSVSSVSSEASDREGDLCDVLTPAEFTVQVKPMISASPSVTGAQVLELRKWLLGFCMERGWVVA